MKQGKQNPSDYYRLLEYIKSRVKLKMWWEVLERIENGADEFKKLATKK